MPPNVAHDLDDRRRVESVERSLLLLKCFQARGELLPLSVLAKRSGLYKSTILRLAASLEHMDFLIRDHDGQFRLGPELARLGTLSEPRDDLEMLLRPALRDLAEKTQESASFHVRNGNDRICLFRASVAHANYNLVEEGGRQVLDSGAAGRILRAYQPGVTGSQAAAIRRRGWDVSYGERDPDLAAVVVPLLDRNDQLVGALAVSGLKVRFTPDRLAQSREALLETAAALRPKVRPRQGDR